MTRRKSVALVAVEAVENVTQYLRVPRLVSIRSRILALAVLGTVIPAAISLGVAYSQNRRAREDKITQELLSESTQSAGAIGVWLKERLYDLRVFATSDEVSNNLTRYAGSSIIGARLREYLRSLHERFPDFDQLLVLDPTGHVLATSAQPQTKPVQLPSDWQKTLRQQGQLVGDAYWDDKIKKGKLIVAVPVQRSDGRLVGAFAAEITLTPVQTLLRSFAYDGGSASLYLTSTEGALIASSREISPKLLETKLTPETLARLSQRENAAITYTGLRGGDVVGTYKHVPRVPWAIVAEMSADDAFRQVRHFRNVALLVVFALLVIVGATAYWLGLIIVRPLERLAEGASEVSTGDLDVDLPDAGGGEVGALTTVFNHMVKRLRQGRQELERLSVTDGLTGLTNHRALMQRLSEERVRSTRSERPFCLIMADVDHFKSYNDMFGHPAGDEVLKRIAVVLRDSTRTMDCVARYGGEEFAMLLPETNIDGGLDMAERIRQRVETEQFPERAVTLSIGVAEFPRDAARAESLIEVADAALYEAKHAGRNRVMQADKSAPAQKSTPRKTAQQEVLPTAKRPARATKKKS